MPATKKKPAPKPKKQPKESIPTPEERKIWAELQDVANPVILVPFANLTAKAIKNLPDVLGVREVTLKEGAQSAFAIPIQYMDNTKIALLQANKKIPY